MHLHRHYQIQNFWQQANAYLLRYPAEHNLLLGICQHLLQNPENCDHSLYLAVVTDTINQILAVAVRTPPYKLVLAKAQNLQALSLIAYDLQVTPAHPPGVTGPVAEVEAFLAAWQQATRQSSHRVMEMKIHELRQVEPMPAVSGYLRAATRAEQLLLTDWYSAFAVEIGEVVSQELNLQRIVAEGLAHQSIFVWEDQVPVSFAFGRPVFTIVGRVGPVYTPPAYRRRGYATACVAALSQQLLDRGCERCFLFTDRSNPTSNHIYQTIGYRPTGDWYDYKFLTTNEC